MTHDPSQDPSQDPIEVRHVPEDQRYEVWAAGERAGFAAYDLGEDQAGDVITFTHTEVADRFEGQGVGSALVRGALDDVRASGRHRVVAECPFVAGWVEAHEAYQDLLA